MKNDYSIYTSDKLLNDTFFLDSELNPTDESKAFWDELETRDERLAEEIRVARKFLHTMKRNANIPALDRESSEELWMHISQENKRYDNKHWSMIRRTAGIAASICLLASITWFVLMEEKPQTDYMAILETVDTPAEVSSENVQLILSNNKKIAIEGKNTQVEYQEEGQVNINSEEKVNLSGDNNTKEESFNQLIVPQGKRSTITFNDGTKVWVNAGSRIIYPVNFDKNRREIFAEGEIYLDVVPDSKRPFIVKTRQMDIKVLGTRFNVSAYEDEAELQVVLVSGKVEVKMQGEKENILTPSQMFSYNNLTHKAEVSTIDVNDFIAWKDGYYQFYQQRLSVVFNKLTKYYGVSFSLDEGLKEMSCSGKLDLKENIGEVLLSLQKAAPIEINKTSEIYQIKVKP